MINFSHNHCNTLKADDCSSLYTKTAKTQQVGKFVLSPGARRLKKIRGYLQCMQSLIQHAITEHRDFLPHLGIVSRTGTMLGCSECYDIHQKQDWAILLKYVHHKEAKLVGFPRHSLSKINVLFSSPLQMPPGNGQLLLSWHVCRLSSIPASAEVKDSVPKCS